MTTNPTYEELEQRILELEQRDRNSKLTDEALNKNEAYLTTLIRTIPDLVWLKDPEGVFLFCNSRFEQLYGAKEEDILGKTDYDFVGREIADGFRNADRHAIAVGAPCRNEEVVTFAIDGHSEILETVKTPIYTKDGRLLGVLGIGRDITERKKNEEQIRHLVALHQTILDTVNVGIIFIQNRETQWTNPAITTMFGYEPEELLGKNASIYYGRKDLYEKIGKEGYARLVKGETYEIELEGQRKDGSLFWCQLTSRAVDPHNMTAGSVWVAQDINERKIAEEKLYNSERNHRDVFDATNDAIFIKEIPSGTIIDMNNAVLKIFGFASSDEAFSNLDDSFIPGIIPYTQERIAEKLQLALTSGHQLFEWRIRHHTSGKLVWVEVSMTMSTLHSGERVIVSVRDISERKDAEKSLKQLAGLHQTILDTVTAGIIFVIDRKIQWANRTMSTFFGYEPDELLGKSVAIFYARKEIYEKVGTEGYAQLMKGETYSIELEGKRKDGSLFWCHLVGKAIDPLKMEEGTVWIVQDITERKALKERLNQMQKIESIGRLAGGVAHDFNNILGAIIGRTEIALYELQDDNPLYEHLHVILEAAERSTALTRQLLAFARKQTIAPKHLDLNATITGMLKMLHTLIGEDIELIWHPASDLWPVRIDPSQLDQVLANLCINARDAITDIGKIIIETKNETIDTIYCSIHPESLPGDYVMLSISDDGSGMDNAVLSQVFEPFFTTKGLGKGTGLGLATVYGNIKQNNGFIDVYSELGIGTIFKIFLPRYNGEVDSIKQESTTVTEIMGHETILLVEDDTTNLKTTSEMLEKLGYNVLAVSKPDEAIHTARDRHTEINMLMSDVIMPGMNGRDLSNAVAAICPTVKCLFMSGYTDEVIAHHGVLDDGIYFIQKPFSLRTLAIKIREVLDMVDPT